MTFTANTIIQAYLSDAHNNPDKFAEIQSALLIRVLPLSLREDICTAFKLHYEKARREAFSKYFYSNNTVKKTLKGLDKQAIEKRIQDLNSGEISKARAVVDELNLEIERYKSNYTKNVQWGKTQESAANCTYIVLWNYIEAHVGSEFKNHELKLRLNSMYDGHVLTAGNYLSTQFMNQMYWAQEVTKSQKILKDATDKLDDLCLELNILETQLALPDADNITKPFHIPPEISTLFANNQDEACDNYFLANEFKLFCDLFDMHRRTSSIPAPLAQNIDTDIKVILNADQTKIAIITALRARITSIKQDSFFFSGSDKRDRLENLITKLQNTTIDFRTPPTVFKDIIQNWENETYKGQTNYEIMAQNRGLFSWLRGLFYSSQKTTTLKLLEEFEQLGDQQNTTHSPM